MENITAIIAETIFTELEQIVDLVYKSNNIFAIIDNCGDTYQVAIEKMF